MTGQDLISNHITFRAGHSQKKNVEEKKMLKHISVPAKAVLDKIAKRRVGRVMGAMEGIDCPAEVKSSIKKEIWDMKRDMEDILEEACYESEPDKQ